MKKTIYIAIGGLAVVIIAVVYLIKDTKQAPVVDEVIVQQIPAEEEIQASVEQADTAEKVEKIMNDNVAGVVEKIDGKVIVIKADDGTLNEMPIAEGKTFVVIQVDSVMEGKEISDIKVGMKAFVHYEKATNLATTITLL